MGIVSEGLAILEKWSGWSRMRDTAEKVPVLEARIAALEEQIGACWRGKFCPKCGRRGTFMDRNRPAEDNGIVREWWRCRAPECGFEHAISYRAKEK